MGRILDYAPRTRERLTCKELVDFLDLYLDGSLSFARRLVFERHLAACADCRRYLREYQKAVRLGKQAFAPLLDDAAAAYEAPEELIGAILSACRKA